MTSQHALLPADRTDLDVVKAVKFNRQELAALERWGELLADTTNPVTGRPFLERGANGKVRFSDLMKFCVNTCHGLISPLT